MLWRRLTAMRTALILLFLLAVAAVPGSLLPQRPLNPAKTHAYIADARRLGHDSSTASACSTCSARLVRRDLPAAVRLAGRLPDPADPGARRARSSRKPLPAPRNLDRLPESGRFDDRGISRSEYADAARGRRWAAAGGSCGARSATAR